MMMRSRLSHLHMTDTLNNTMSVVISSFGLDTMRWRLPRRSCDICVVVKMIEVASGKAALHARRPT